jgi:Na+/glutamate symporter
MIAKSKENLQLLLTLGYSPNWLSKTVAKTWIPVYVIVVIAAIIITALLHYAFVKISFVERNELSYFLHWSVVAVSILLLFLSVFTNYQLVKKELYRIV